MVQRRPPPQCGRDRSGIHSLTQSLRTQSLVCKNRASASTARSTMVNTLRASIDMPTELSSMNCEANTSSPSMQEVAEHPHTAVQFATICIAGVSFDAQEHNTLPRNSLTERLAKVQERGEMYSSHSQYGSSRCAVAWRGVGGQMAKVEHTAAARRRELDHRAGGRAQRTLRLAKKPPARIMGIRVTPTS